MTDRRQAPWTDDDRKTLIELIQSGGSPSRAAAKLKRTTVAVRDQARRLGFHFATIKERRNLMRANKDDSKTG